MYIDLHMVAYSKNKETKNWVSDYSKQKTGNVLGANLISATNKVFQQKMPLDNRESENLPFPTGFFRSC